MTITTLHGDCRETLATLPEKSVQCVVTSPPYFGLRKYSDDPREIGQEPTPALYVAAMVDVFAQVWRVLRDDGVVFLNLGDSYNGTKVGNTNGGASSGLKRDGRDESSRLQTNNALSKDMASMDFKKALAPGLKEKDLIGIPWRVAFALQDDGWYLRSDIVWSKPNCMPESVTDRPTRAHEYVFLLTKSARYFYDLEAIREDPRPHNKAAQGKPQYSPKMGPNRIHGTKEQNIKTYAVVKGGNKRTVWTIATQPYSGAHYATMPEALIEPCILAGSRAGNTVLDPFGGSGTVGRVAMRLQRSAVLCELNADYITEHIEKRTDGVQVELFV